MAGRVIKLRNQSQAKERAEARSLADAWLELENEYVRLREISERIGVQQQGLREGKMKVEREMGAMFSISTKHVIRCSDGTLLMVEHAGYGTTSDRQAVMRVERVEG